MAEEKSPSIRSSNVAEKRELFAVRHCSEREMQQHSNELRSFFMSL